MSSAGGGSQRLQDAARDTNANPKRATIPLHETGSCIQLQTPNTTEQNSLYLVVVD